MVVLRKLLIGVGLAAGMLTLTELALELFVPVDRLLFRWEQPDGVPWDPEIATRLTPSRSVFTNDGPYPWRYHLNAQSFREDADTPVRAPAGVHRWLAVGDSWIFGFSVDQGHTIADELERILTARTGEPWEFLNAGIPGAGAFDMLRRYGGVVNVFELEGVLIGQPHNTWRAGRDPTVRATWYAEAREGPASTLRLYLLLRLGLTRLRSPAVPTGTPAEDEDLHDIATLLADARGRGLTTTFVSFPTRWDPSGHPVGGDATRWGVEAQRRGAIVAGHALWDRACWGFEDEVHPSEAGARAIAERIADAMTTGVGSPEPVNEPACGDVPGVGPGKPL